MKKTAFKKLISEYVWKNKQKYRNKESNAEEIVWKRQIKKEKIHERIQKKEITQCVEENKRKLWVGQCWSRCSNQFHQRWSRNFFVDVDTDIGDDIDDDEKNRIITFRYLWLGIKY